MNIIKNLLFIYLTNLKLKGNILFITIILFIISGFILLTFFLMYYEKKSRHNQILKMYHCDRIFVINYKDKIVDFFDYNNLKKISTIQFFDFLKFFPEQEQNNIRAYIAGLLNLEFDKKSKDSVILTNIKIQYKKKSVAYRTILKCRYIDKTNQILYIDSSRLMNSPSFNFKRSSKKDIYEIKEIKKLYDEGKFNKGSFYLLNFTMNNKVNSFINNHVFKIILIDSIYKITNNNTSCFFLNDDNLEIGLLDNRNFTSLEMSTFLSKIVKRIEIAFELNGLKDLYNYYICSSLVCDLPLYYDDAYITLSTFLKKSKDINRVISVYKSNDKNILTEFNFKNEINKIIKHSEFKIKYQPIIQIKPHAITINGYFVSIDINSKFINDYNSFINYVKNYSMLDNVLTTLLNKIVPNFVNQIDDKNLKLIINLDLDSFKVVKDILPKIHKINDCKLEIVLNSSEITNIEDENDEIIMIIRELKKNGHFVSLLIKNDDLILKERIYRIFNNYYVDSALENDLKEDSRSLIKASSLFSYLQKMNHKVIAMNINSFSAIELLLNLSINHFSSVVISKSEEMVLPLDNKVVKKLLNLRK